MSRRGSCSGADARASRPSSRRASRGSATAEDGVRAFDRFHFEHRLPIGFEQSQAHGDHALVAELDRVGQ